MRQIDPAFRTIPAADTIAAAARDFQVLTGIAPDRVRIGRPLARQLAREMSRWIRPKQRPAAAYRAILKGGSTVNGIAIAVDHFRRNVYFPISRPDLQSVIREATFAAGPDPDKENPPA